MRISLELATENETPMKAKKLAAEGTPFNDDDQRKRIMDYDLRVCTWNIRSLNRDGASALLVEILIECGGDITTIQEMRWIGQECTCKYTAASTTAANRRGANSGAGSWLAGDYDTLSQLSAR